LLWLASCDGTALPNPGRIGIGVVLIAPSGEKFTLAEAAGRGCNNEAEVAALIAALTFARTHKARRIHVQTDSAVIIAQTTGPKRTTIDRLAKPFAIARALIATFECVELQLVSRRNNTQADTLARAAVGLPQKLPSQIRLSKKRRKR
jgi:ribonuclease HI